VGKHLREGSRFFRVDRVFALLIESGIIYCCIWIMIWVCPTSGSIFAEGFTTLLQVWRPPFGMLPSPGLNIIVFISVSIAHVFLPHILNIDLLRVYIRR
jgi:hypothetical protein